MPNTETRPNAIDQKSMDPSSRDAISFVTAQNPSFTASTNFWVIKCALLVKQIKKVVTSTAVLAFDSLVFNTPFSVMLVDANLRMICQEKQNKYPVTSSFVVRKFTDPRTAQLLERAIWERILNVTKLQRQWRFQQRHKSQYSCEPQTTQYE